MDSVLKGWWSMGDLAMRPFQFGVALLRECASDVRVWLVGLGVGANGRWHGCGAEYRGLVGGASVENE
eukprot:6291175-Alexandrium_andersonii.AAC.1